jgi:hypothetical protein
MSTIKINYLFEKQQFQIIPLHGKRQWMNDTPNAYAYKCVPLTVANTYGWSVINPNGFTATWDGRPENDAISVKYDNTPAGYASCIFGSGILTIHVDFVIKTEENISTFVRGVPNFIKDGIQPLDGIIETDWLPFTFTFNFRFTRPGSVHFDAGESLFAFFPIERGSIEQYDILYQPISADPQFEADYNEYRNARAQNPNTNQKFYANAKGPKKLYEVENHQKKTTVKQPKEAL